MMKEGVWCLCWWVCLRDEKDNKTEEVALSYILP